MKKIKKIFYVLLGMAIGVLFIFYYFNSSMGHGSEKMFTVHQGEKLKNIAKRLKDENLTRHHSFFYYYGRVKLMGGKGIKRGKYKLKDDMTSGEIIDMLISGKAIPDQVTLTVPEGYNIYDIAKLLVDKGFAKQTEDFLEVVRDEKLLKKYGVKGDSMEGYLYPTTYFVRPKESLKSIANRMAKIFQSKFPNHEFESRKDELKLSKHEVVTLASLVEKETGVSEERNTVSSVYYNRLNLQKRFKSSMRLACDPTVIYGLLREAYGTAGETSQDRFASVYKLLKEGDTKKALTWTVRILRSQKQNLSHASGSPFNSYKYKGLPPSPIANPSRESI
ncbi:MAG: endolytic transglycosylase MltG, partial [Spirochaetota bacterium]|nr:endolytic transglycosylase MltG [Spirochaetota bacterium]